MGNTTTKYQPGDRLGRITFITQEYSKRASDSRWRVRCACGHEDPINWDYYIPAFATLINQYRHIK